MIHFHGGCSWIFHINVLGETGESPLVPSKAELFLSWAWSMLFLLDSIWIPSPDFTGFYGWVTAAFLRLSSL
jgi:hypothetical protein